MTHDSVQEEKNNATLFISSVVVCFLVMGIKLPYFQLLFDRIPSDSLPLLNQFQFIYPVFCLLLPIATVLFVFRLKFGWILLISFFISDLVIGVVHLLNHIFVLHTEELFEFMAVPIYYIFTGYLLEALFIWLLFSPSLKKMMR
ncbi:MAG: hypothetical protein ACHQF2_02460 [Flavobacteriales bacterium]